MDEHSDELFDEGARAGRGAVAEEEARVTRRAKREAGGAAAAAPPLSGSYEGEMSAPTGGRDLLVLRVDVDARYPNSPVMNRLSGDFFQVNRVNLPGSPPRVWRVYRESWVVSAPQVTARGKEVLITGQVRFWNGIHPPTGITVRIARKEAGRVGPAEVTFSRQGGTASSYSCVKTSDSFRSLNLEVDVCRSVSTDALGTPLLPRYDTGAHKDRPADLARRTLTLEEAYREAGVDIAVREDHTVIDDSAPGFESWSDAELHDALENHFSQRGGQWPQWEMWGILAGTYDSRKVGGIMFDAAADFGGAGKSPERQGFAVFRNHEWFKELPKAAPENAAQAAALRKLLYTWVHEAGHAFNFLHSWDKNRPDSLSWMNYDWRYDNRNGADQFWANFRFRFDDEELLHLRHGNRPSVIMGGDPWASGGHLEAPPGAEHLQAPPGALSHAEGQVPAELLLRSKEYFEFMEPVVVELRIRNLFPDLPLHLDTNLNPEYGGTVIYIRRPDGRIVEYSPIMCKLANGDIKPLQPSGVGREDGSDRHSENIFISYGRYGFYFDQPGVYLLRALYQGPGDLLIPSNVHRLRVGAPLTQDEDRIAQDFFSYEVGMSLYLRGSWSPHLKRGMEVVEEVVERYEGTMRSARVAHRVATGIADPFFSVEGRGLTKAYSGDPAKAIKMTEGALELYKQSEQKALNIPYNRLVQLRAPYLQQLGRERQAQKEIKTLVNDLQERGVHEAALAPIRALAQSIPAPTASAARGASKKRAARKSPAKNRAIKRRG